MPPGTDRLDIAAAVLAIGMGTITTLELFACVVIIGLVVGLALTIFELCGIAPIRVLINVYDRLFRGISPFILLFLFYFGFRGHYNIESFTAAALALGLRSSAFQAKVFLSAIRSIPRVQVLAARALGMNNLQVIRHVLVPQAIAFGIGPWSNELSSELKNTSLAFAIGVIELLRQGKYIISTTRGHTLEVYAMCGFFYFIIIRTINAILYWIELKLAFPKL